MVAADFIDTSVLVNLLEVPGKSQNVTEAKTGLAERGRDGVTLLLPITTVIETGNHIAQVKGNLHQKEQCATKFTQMLQMIASGKSPWTPNELTWNSTFIDDLLSGVNTGQKLEHLLSSGIFGAGDLAILAEAKEYKRRLGVGRVRIWTLEAELGAYSDL